MHDRLNVNDTQSTTFAYDRGVLSGTHTTLSDVTMAINWDGSVHTSTQVGRTTQEARTTTYAYDDLAGSRACSPHSDRR